MVKALFFDLTDTLQNFDWSKQWKLLKAVLQRLEINVYFNKFKRNYQKMYELYRTGKIKNDFEFFYLLFKELNLKIDKNKINQLVKEHLRIRKHYTWLPKGYDKTLKALGKDFKLAIVTSGVRTWADYDYKKIFGFDISKHFDAQIWSQDYGYIKESGRLFKIALKKLKLKPKDVAFVGNDSGDVRIAKKHGLKSILISKKRFGKEDIRIKEFKDLLKVKDKLKKL